MGRRPAYAPTPSDPHSKLVSTWGLAELDAERRVGGGAAGRQGDQTPRRLQGSRPFDATRLVQYECSTMAYFKMVDEDGYVCFPDEHQLGLDVLVRVARNTSGVQ